ncbi:calcineurin B homologous protein 2 [Drosophila montana]|uniref:calcineurin B homologous protein 2 n=1 Tax=Drosophila montana TaxID=40370 RepID=UPI00313CF2BB
MGLMASHQLSASELSAYQATTGLSTEQLEQLHTRFQALDRRQRGYLTPTELLRIPQLAQNPLHRQIIDGFFAVKVIKEADSDVNNGKATDADANTTADADATSGNRIYFGQFVRTCATFMVPQFGQLAHMRADGRAQKLRLLSQMFDTQRSGRIERGDFRRTMKCLLDSVPPSDGVANLHPQGSETELQQLEELAFGASDSISYEQFEQRLATADVEGGLAVRKWLEEPADEAN